MISAGSKRQSLKYRRLTLTGSKGNGIRKLEFYVIDQLYYLSSGHAKGGDFVL